MIKELLNELPDQLRRQLMFAFEQGIEQMVELDDNTFLGVNMLNTDKLAVEETAGHFIYGRIIK